MDIEKTAKILEGCVEKSCQEKTGILYSAGVDSAIIAKIASKFSDITAYTVGVEGSPDMTYALKTAEEIGFEVKPVEINLEGVEKILPQLVKVVDDANPVKVSVGIPMYFASKAAKEDDLEVMLCGQGSDELFGGYWRYIEAYINEGPEKVEEMMKSDVETADEDNLNRDRAVCNHNGIELRVPYVQEEFVDFVEKLPLSEKVREVQDNEYECTDEIGGRRFIRKYLVRKLAEYYKLPKDIIHRPKKAAQYGSSSQKLIDKIARKQGYKQKAADKGRNDYVRYFLEELHK